MDTPKEVKNLIDRYCNLELGGKKISTPYYINKKHSRGGELRALTGKGTPSEIEEEVKIFAKLRGFNLEKSTKEEIISFMKEEGIGIDCSGLVSHILDTWLKSTGHKTLYRNIVFGEKSLRNTIIRCLRPIQNISANTLSNKDNAMPINLEDVQVGDLLRLKGLKHGDHIAIIIEINKKSKSRFEIEYVHSTPHYGKINGIRKGKIIVVNPEKDLEEQEWTEIDENKVCWTLKQYLKEKDDNGIRRPKFFINIE